jgi:hypothetical protein
MTDRVRIVISKKTNPVTIAIPAEVHERMKREADVRGMKLRDLPHFLLELAEVATPEQRSAALDRFITQRSRRPSVAGSR